MSLQSVLDGNNLAVRIAAWTDELCKSYLARYPENPHKSPKDLNDAVAGIVRLRPWEVYLVDSPILQRLRFIRQLGVGHLLFPSSGYSRFEHSIGVVKTASRMFDAICDYEMQSGGQKLPYTESELHERKDVVRLAALLHDIGHCVFSHVSERYYGRDSELKATVASLSSYFATNVTPAESLSILIVQSAAFRRLLAASMMRRAAFADAQVIEMVCACIAGSKSRLEPDCFMAEIVNGPVDCDKLDYVARDAHSAGVPASLDTDRLLSKLRIAILKKNGATQYSLAVVQSGMRALDELIVSRIFLFDKFYYHPKVMAAEELLRRALFYLARSIPQLASPLGLLAFGDDDFLALDCQTAAMKFEVDETDEHVVRGCALLRRLRDRQLPRRSFAFASRFLPEHPELIGRLHGGGPAGSTGIGQYEYKRVSRRLEDPEFKDAFVRTVAAYAEELGANTEVFVGVQSAARAAGGAYLPILLPDGTIEEKPRFLFKTSEWTEAYALNKQTQYVFADDHIESVHVAAERAFLELDLSFAPNAADVAKVRRDKVKEVRTKLPHLKSESGQAEWIPYRLSPDYLTTAEASSRVRALEARFAPFTASLQESVREPLLRSFLAQFGDADLQESAIRLLEFLTFVGPSELVSGFGNLATSDMALAKALWIPFRARTGGGDSADHLSWATKELRLKFSPSASLSPQILAPSERIVFFDDHLNTGVQAVSRLASWFGRNDLVKYAKDADPAGALDEETQELLRKRPVRFAYYASHPTGRQELLSVAQQLSMQVERIDSVIDTGEAKHRLDGLVCESVDSKIRFVKVLDEKGKFLLGGRVARREDGWSTDRVNASALGYGGLSLTVVFSHAVGTSCPVALWEHSFERRFEWIPPFPRKWSDFDKRLEGSSSWKEPIKQVADG